MSESNYKLGFYLTEVAANQYNLLNTVTEKLVLKEESKEKIIDFLSLRLPSPPGLPQADQKYNHYVFSSISEEDLSRYAASADSYTLTSVSFYNPQFNYESYPDQYDCEFNVFNYDHAPDTTLNNNVFVVGEGEDTDHPTYSQLEFDFTYKDKETIEPDVDTPIEDEEFPYLPED